MENQNSLLLDSLYINRSGSNVLLKYLVEQIEAQKLNCHYIFDDRNCNQFPNIPNNRKTILKSSTFARLKYYINNQHKFSKILCFAGVPPPLKIKALVLCYFHNMSILPAKKSFNVDIKRLTKFFYLKIFSKNVNQWIVQTDYVKECLINKVNLNPTCIFVLPFFKTLETNLPNQKKANFLFVSEYFPHKNHITLFEAFNILSKEFPDCKLYITIDNKNEIGINFYKKYYEKNNNIINLGFVPNVDIKSLYSVAQCIVFPSIEESFGLGLIEATQLGLDVLASDLPFVHKVIIPTDVFNPYDEKDIAIKLKVYLENNTNRKPKLIATNKIAEIISMLES